MDHRSFIFGLPQSIQTPKFMSALAILPLEQNFQKAAYLGYAGGTEYRADHEL